jgi:hypothetical protein
VRSRVRTGRALSIRTSKSEVVVPEEDEECPGEGLRKILVPNPRLVGQSEVSGKGACCRPAVPKYWGSCRNQR